MLSSVSVCVPAGAGAEAAAPDRRNSWGHKMKKKTREDGRGKDFNLK